jgi:threonine dehydrogenase-like Zn-dependent dehydrogenase
MGALAAAGPMGLAFIDYIIHCGRRPSLLVVTDIDQSRLDRAKSVLTPENAAREGVELIYINTQGLAGPVEKLRELSGGGGYDDVFVFAPVSAVVEQADAILSHDGCMNFFAGPSDHTFSAKFNFYNVHYNSTHVVGTSGGNTDDMKEALELASAGVINPSILITHIGGLDAACEATLKLPEIPGGKKLIYTHIQMPLTAIKDFRALGGDDPLFAALAQLCEGGGGLWNAEAEKYLLTHAAPI